MSDLIHEFHLALRSLRAGKGLTLAALLTVAVGIGGTAAIFTVVHSVLLRPLPYANAERLVDISDSFLGQDLHHIPLSVAEYLDVRARTRSYEEVGAYAGGSTVLTGSDDPVRLDAGYVTASLFRTLSVQPLIGRLWDDAWDDAGQPPVVVLGESLWRARFGADPTIIGRSLVLEGVPTTVVAVLPESFELPQGSRVWFPLGFTAEQKQPTARGNRFLRTVGRLEPGVPVEQARAEIEQLTATLRAEHPTNYLPKAQWTLHVRPLAERFVGSVRPALLMLIAAVSLVLLIACANVANLLLARAAARRSEMAIRGALGASRGRIIRQLLIESVTLSAVGGAAGILIAVWGVDLLLSLAPSLPRADEVQLRPIVVAMMFGVSLLTGVLFGLAPALHASRTELQASMNDALRVTTAAGGKVRRGLVIAQVALALLLLVGAGLMLRSLSAVTEQDLGFDPNQVSAASITLPQPEYAELPRAAAAIAELETRLQALPGVAAAGVVSILPFEGQSDRSFMIEGAPVPDGGVLPNAEYRVASPGYARAIGLRLREGRFFEPGDRSESERVVVLNEAAERRYFSGAPALGRRIRMGGQSSTRPWMKVVGVVRDTRELGLEDEPQPMLYVSLLQETAPEVNVAIRSVGASAELMNRVGDEVLAVDPNLPLADVRSLESVVAKAKGPRRFATTLLLLFAAVALLLAVIGLYGLTQDAVVQRRREIGVRLALGATQGSVIRLFLREGLRLALVGVALGAVASFAASRLFEHLLYGVSPSDPSTFVAMAGLLCAVSAFATWVPALKTAKLSPASALQAE